MRGERGSVAFPEPSLERQPTLEGPAIWCNSCGNHARLTVLAGADPGRGSSRQIRSRAGMSERLEEQTAGSALRPWFGDYR